MTTIDQSITAKTDPLARLENAYAEKQADYFEYQRPEMFQLLPVLAKRVLDIGCGSGVFGQSLKKHFGCEVWGVEPDRKSFEKAVPRLDHVVHGYFDDKLELPAGYFDCIFFNDVLEHMIDPAFALGLAKKLLSPRGKIIASIPNIAHFPTVWRLAMRGQWKYTERGILDRTHLRFFTRQSISALFTEAGFAVEHLDGINEYAWNETGDARIWKIYRILSLLPNRSIREMRYLQYAVIAGQAPKPQCE
jgi:SAM-dependent methyltransferase